MAEEERATGGGEQASWANTVRADSRDVSEVQVEAAGADAAAAVERKHVEAMKRADRAEEEKGAALARSKIGETIAGISSGAIPSPRRAAGEPDTPTTRWKDKDECEAAAKERSQLEKVAKEMADLAATRKHERRTSANPRDLKDFA